MDHVVLKAHNLPERLRIMANMKSEQDAPSIADLFVQAYMDDLLPNKILEAIRERDSLKVLQ